MTQAHYKRGFTLIELLVVISIISLLSSIILSALNGARIKARETHRIEELKQIQIALELYYTKFHQYPLSEGHDYEPDSDHWANDCDGHTGPLIPELVTAGFFSGVKDIISCPGHQGFSYGSNGTDYKLVAHSEGYGSDSYTGLRSFIDPAADSGFDNCTVDGGYYEHFGIWTQGATCWIESDPIPGR